MAMDLHSHSDYSDGADSPERMIEAAIEAGYDTFAVTDHVWKTSDWVPAYARHLNRLKGAYASRIAVLAGIEAKATDLEGGIDADPSFDPLVDLVLGSIHRLPKPGGYYARAEAAAAAPADVLAHWQRAFAGLLGNPRVDIIAHPLAELAAYGLPTDRVPFAELADRIKASGKLLEFNVRYNTLDDPLVRFCAQRGVPFVISSDSHSAEALLAHSRTIVPLYEQDRLPVADIHSYLRRKKKLPLPDSGRAGGS